MNIDVLHPYSYRNIKHIDIIVNSQMECNEDMGGIVDKLRSLKHNISGVVEPTQQLFNKFVIEESLK